MKKYFIIIFLFSCSGKIGDQYSFSIKNCVKSESNIHYGYGFTMGGKYGWGLVMSDDCVQYQCFQGIKEIKSKFIGINNYKINEQYEVKCK